MVAVASSMEGGTILMTDGRIAGQAAAFLAMARHSALRAASWQRVIAHVA